MIRAFPNPLKNPLIYAFENTEGKGAMIRLLLDNNVDLNEVDEEGQTLLMYAIYYANDDVIDILLEKKVDIYQKRNNGDMAIHVAIRCSRFQALFDLMRFMEFPNEYGELIMQKAIEEDQFDMVDYMIYHKNVDLNTFKNGNNVFICNAIQYDRYGICELLFEAGARLHE